MFIITSRHIIPALYLTLIHVCLHVLPPQLHPQSQHGSSWVFLSDWLKPLALLPFCSFPYLFVALGDWGLFSGRTNSFVERTEAALHLQM